MDLFAVPPGIALCDPSSSVPAGGIGGGAFRFSPEGTFHNWQMEPSSPPIDVDVPANRFHFWWRQGPESDARSLDADRNPVYAWPAAEFTPLYLRLFPFGWRDVSSLDCPVQ